MSFLYDNLAVIFLALVASLLGWVYGGIDAGPLSKLVPWLMLFMVEVIFVFPQKHQGESTYDARERVWEALKRDPLVWTALGFMVLLAIPFVNNGLCVSCDRALIAQGHSPEPLVKFLPYCVNRWQHYNVFLWFSAALSSMIAVKHCLCRRGKRMVLKMIVWNGFVLAIFGFVETVTGASGPFWQPFANVDKASTFFATFGYPNMAGDYFTTIFGISVALWRRAHDEVRDEFNAFDDEVKKHPRTLFWRKNYYLIPAAVAFFAAMNTLSRAAILLASSLAAIYFIHAFISFTHRMHRAERLKKGTIAIAVMGIVVFFATITMPEDMQKEVDTLDADTVLTRVTGKGQYHVRVAKEIWKDNFLFGCGGWGYKHFCIPKMTPAEWKDIQMVGGINVHNDYMQFLAEHGTVGFLSLVAMVIMLLYPIAKVWRHRAKACRFMKPSQLPAKPVQIFVMSAPVFCILMTTLATLIHSFGDCAMRSPAVLTLFFISLATLPGFLPKKD